MNSIEREITPGNEQAAADGLAFVADLLAATTKVKAQGEIPTPARVDEAMGRILKGAVQDKTTREPIPYMLEDLTPKDPKTTDSKESASIDLTPGVPAQIRPATETPPVSRREKRIA